MSVNQNIKVAYGFTEPLPAMSPQPIISNRNPTNTDRAELSTIWINKLTNDFFVLTSVVANISTWSSLSNGAGIFASLEATAGNITADVGDIVATVGNVTAGSDLTAGANINLPNTTAAFAAGTINFGGTPTVSNYGTDNMFVGANSGNATLTVVSAVGNTAVGTLALNALTTGSDNSAFGFTALTDCTTGSNNTAIGSVALGDCTTGTLNVAVGSNALTLLTTASSNVAVGDGALSALLTGANNIGLGYNAGISYVAAEASNIVIGNSGTIGDTHTIRIGTDGGGAGQQTAAFIAGDVTAARSVIATKNLITAGDTGAGVAAETAFTNVVNTSQSTGTLAVKSTTANPGNNAGFLKIYVGVTVAYIPYWTNIAP